MTILLCNNMYSGRVNDMPMKNTLNMERKEEYVYFIRTDYAHEIYDDI
jgi:hypothetical protein